MITAKEARKQVTKSIDCKKELVEIEQCIMAAVLSGKLETSTILSNTSDAKLTKLIDILHSNGYKACYVPSHRGAYLFHVSW